MTTYQDLFNFLSLYGGNIVSSSSLSPEWIEQAKASGRIYVDVNNLGFVWEPDIKGFPQTEEEIAFFEKWYPLPCKLPESLIDPKKIIERVEREELENKQKREN